MNQTLNFPIFFEFCPIDLFPFILILFVQFLFSSKTLLFLLKRRVFCSHPFLSFSNRFILAVRSVLCIPFSCLAKFTSITVYCVMSWHSNVKKKRNRVTPLGQLCGNFEVICHAYTVRLNFFYFQPNCRENVIANSLIIVKKFAKIYNALLFQRNIKFCLKLGSLCSKFLIFLAKDVVR